MKGPRLATSGRRYVQGLRDEREEEDLDALEAEMEALEAGEDVYTRTNRLFMEPHNDTSAGKKVATRLDKERHATLPPSSSHPMAPQPETKQPRPQPQPQPQPHLWAPAPAPETQPGSSQQRPGPSSTQRSPRKQTTDELMRFLVGGMADLAIPMAQDGGGRWRISHRRK